MNHIFNVLASPRDNYSGFLNFSPEILRLLLQEYFVILLATRM